METLNESTGNVRCDDVEDICSEMSEDLLGTSKPLTLTSEDRLDGKTLGTEDREDSEPSVDTRQPKEPAEKKPKGVLNKVGSGIRGLLKKSLSRAKPKISEHLDLTDFIKGQGSEIRVPVSARVRGQGTISKIPLEYQELLKNQRSVFESFHESESSVRIDPVFCQD